MPRHVEQEQEFTIHKESAHSRAFYPEEAKAYKPYRQVLSPYEQIRDAEVAAEKFYKSPYYKQHMLSPHEHMRDADAYTNRSGASSKSTERLLDRGYQRDGYSSGEEPYESRRDRRWEFDPYERRGSRVPTLPMEPSAPT